MPTLGVKTNSEGQRTTANSFLGMGLGLVAMWITGGILFGLIVWYIWFKYL